jgi:hypothetical protein
MKKILILSMILFAALENYGQFTFGPKIGYNTSKLSTDFDNISESIKNNFQIGAFARFGKKLYLQPEIFYATSGGKLKQSDSDGGIGEIKLKNLSIPALVGYKLINAKVISLRIMAGPVANFILNKEVTSDEFYQDPLQDSDFKNAAWGMDVGAGVDVFFLTLDVRYEFGLNNIYIVPEGAQDQSVKSNLFIVSLGFKLL